MKLRQLSVCLGLLALLGCSHILLRNPRPERIEARKDFHWTVERSGDGRFTFLIEQGAEPPSERALREATLRSSVERSLAFLQEPAADEHFTYVVVRSPERMKALIGLSMPPGSAITFPPTNLICGDPGTWRQAHEVAHMVSKHHWGETDPWMSEGLAVAVDDQWWNCDLYALAKHLREKGQLIPLPLLIRQFEKADSLITYPEAGSFVKFLKETYDTAKVKAIWKQGASHIPEILGVDLPTLEKQWLARVAQADDRGMEYKVRSEQ